MSVELSLRLKGEVVESNLPEFREFVSERLKEVNTELSTDEDFGQAELDVKALTDLQGGIKTARNKAIEEAGRLTAVLSELDETEEEVRQVRLNLDKAVKGQKAKIKQSIIEESVALFVKGSGLTEARASAVRGLVEGAVKGKRTLETMRGAADVVIKTKLGEVSRCRELLVAFVDADQARESLISDFNTLLCYDPAALPAELENRIARHEALQAKAKAEAEAAQARKEAAAAKKEAEEASKPPAAPIEKKAEERVPHDPVEQSEAEEWEDYKAALFRALASVKAHREALKHEANQRKGEAFAVKLQEAWKEINA